MNRNLMDYSKKGERKYFGTNYVISASEMHSLIDFARNGETPPDCIFETVMIAYGAGFEAGCRYSRKERCVK